MNVTRVDVGEAFVHMLRQRPEHGFGKLLNPCVDCKILMMRQTRELMAHYGASFVVSGEVLGQRPMSQRRDTLNVIRRDSGLRAVLLRPLSAKFMDPTEAELSGLVDREKLHAFSGRGCKQQLQLAAALGITEIPTPAGGCRLTEQENACRYWMVLEKVAQPTAADFELAQTGRQYWSDASRGLHWLCIGRNAANNAMLENLYCDADLMFRMRDFAGPLALGRQIRLWDAQTVKDAAALVASFDPHAVRQGGEVVVTVRQGERKQEVTVLPSRESASQWREPLWNEAKDAIRAEARDRQHVEAPSNASSQIK